MPDSRIPAVNLPNKKDLVALFKSYGPGWMLTALLAVTAPLSFAGLGYLIHAVADLIRALHG